MRRSGLLSNLTNPKNICFSLGLRAFLLLALLGGGAAGATQPHESAAAQSYYERGLAEKEKGNFEAVLHIWEQAQAELDEPDFRIAQAYIELVAGQGMKQKYRSASQIYFWGLSGAVESKEKPFLKQELRYLQPLIGDGDYKDYKNAVEDDEAQVLADIEAYWQRIDPTPLTPYNERLLEHWERIAYAHTNYARPTGELDDRAFTYLKYGHPYYKKKGQLNYMPAFVARLLKEGIRMPSFGSTDQMSMVMSQRMNLENRVRRYHSYPQYEIWLYRGLTDDYNNTVFIFGTKDGVSSMTKIRSVDEFIPNEAYRTSGQHNFSFISGGAGGVGNSSQDRQRSRESLQANTRASSQQGVGQVEFSAALILQLMYYHQFAALDEYFGKSYNDMMDRFTSRSMGSRKGMAREFGSIYGSKLLHIQQRAPDEVSEYVNEMMDLPTRTYAYRFLSDDNEPMVRLFAVSSIEEAAYYDLLKETNSLQSDVRNRYELLSGYKVVNREGESSPAVQSPALPVTSVGETVRMLEIPYQGGDATLVFSNELHSVDGEEQSQITGDTPYPQSLKGLHTQRVELPPPLDTDKVMISDLMIGYARPQQTEPASYTDAQKGWDFAIAHDKVIPQGQELHLYYEVYNLAIGEEKGIAEYSFEYAIRSEKRGFLGIGNRLDEEQLSITINSTSATERDANTVIINTSAYQPGNYQLQIEVVDQNSQERFTKTLDFTIR